jgi:SPP1 gp7 family putative phage head morphogenesis protein
MPIRANLSLEPKDAVSFFAGKGDQPSFDYTEVWREANVHAFTVAKATTSDVLRTIRAEVEKAIGPGQTFEEFKRTLRPRLQDLGWWGQAEVLEGETGEIRKVQLGSVRRLRTIYQTNVQTAYMAGRYKRLLANAAERPYWRYVAVMDGRTRPAHAALNGRVWRFDDPIWEVIFPPNGWGCRCRVVALTEAEFQALGVPLESGADAIVTTQVPIGRDGQMVDVKGVRYKDALGREKVFRPDPGWDYNPGAAWSRFDPAGFAGENVPAPPAAVPGPALPAPAAAPAATAPVVSTRMTAAEGVKSWQEYGRPGLLDAAVERLPQQMVLAAASSPEEAGTQLSRAILGFRQQLRVVDTPVGEVPLKAELLPASVAAATGRERFANFVVPTLEKPFEVWLTPYADGVYRRRFLAIFDGRTPVVMVLRESRDGSLAWSMYELSERTEEALNEARKGVLLYGQ